MSKHVPYREITSLYLVPDAEHDRVLLMRTIQNKYGLRDSANLGYMSNTAWEKFIRAEYVRINRPGTTLCEQFILEEEA
ncbi:MAG: hypothetical protein DWB56_14740 [Candidatus Jettenia sp.]|uniref:hypothetical protein n=1 Tax=Candidatus Jettenia sp. AMX1 TaxID=2293637 RepID=UPI00058E71E1|nr:hypothetical protein [Candidatus Jettenia sp. AMX1]KAA0243599.1 MAG: hypothetical protein EDM70_10105 [Candidatus Brocadia sp. AMX2]MBC6930189.1 hypothetical protein [Candidatus Jettenia sp.]RIJ88501.1 MAG: hypothetical protein DCC43_16075 [Candidatus Brocadia sp.]GIL19487.1 MAG: hypothetical protein BroJett041_06010 [Candidatus Jettenia caeni]MCQ3927063.1 hypothetical protein [Candidatus Jettenia sp.]